MTAAPARPRTPFLAPTAAETSAAHWCGFATVSACLIPHLGAGGASLLGVHPRVVGGMLAAAAVAIAVHATPARILFHRRPPGPLLCSLALLVALIASLPYDGPLLAMDWAGLHDYPAYKLTRLLIISAPLVATCVVVAPLAGTHAFRRGVTLGCVVSGVLAAVQCVTHRNHLASEFHYALELGGFSSINIALNLNYLAAAAVGSYLWRRTRGGLLFAMAGVLAATICSYLLAQRAGVLLIVFTCSYAAGRLAGGRLRSSMTLAATAVLALAGLYALGQSGHALMSSYQTQFMRFCSAFVDTGADNSLLVRGEMWEFGLRRGLARPLGHGFGSFASDYPSHEFLYPHNAIVEALYELGWLGGVAMLGLAAIALATILRLRSIGWDVYALCLLTSIAYSFKTGDLTVVGELLMWVWLSTGATQMARGAAPRTTDERPLPLEARQVARRARPRLARRTPRRGRLALPVAGVVPHTSETPAR